MTIQHVFKTTDFLWELCTRSLAENVRSSLVDQSGCLTMTFQCMCNGVGGPREYEPGLIPEPTVLG
jgi:hypothetical protein